MNNIELANKLQALFPLKDIHMRVALVSVLKAVLAVRTNKAEYLSAFKQELLNQPLLMQTLFPGESRNAVRGALSGLTTNEPSLADMCSLLTKNLLIDNIYEIEDKEILQKISDEMAVPASRRSFIWQLMNGQDADEVIQIIENQIDEIRTVDEASVSTISDRPSSPKGSMSDDPSSASTIVDRYSSSKSSMSDLTDNMYTRTRPLFYLIDTDRKMTATELNLLVYSGCNRKVTEQDRKRSIETLRFIYHELQKPSHERCDALKIISDNANATQSDNTIERTICTRILDKLNKYFQTGLTDKKADTADYRSKLGTMKGDTSIEPNSKIKTPGRR